MNPLAPSTRITLFSVATVLPLFLLQNSSAQKPVYIEHAASLKSSALRCSLDIEQDVYTTTAGSELSIEWNMFGDTSTEIFLSVFTSQGKSYILSTVVPNTGKYTIELPEDLGSEQDYTVYIESAENKRRNMSCWDHADLELSKQACSLDIERGLHVVTQDSVSIDWSMSGFQTDQIYLSVFLGEGEVYLLKTIQPNTGSFEWNVPSWLDSERVYSVYIEDAHNGRRGTRCWDHSELIVRAS